MSAYSPELLKLAATTVIPLQPEEDSVSLINQLCGDQISIGALISSGIIVEIHWRVEGCSILRASAAYLAATVSGLSPQAAIESINFFKQTFEISSASDPENPLAAVYALPARYKCALLPWQAGENFLRNFLR
jgi:NifU-like protein involved in Fe-S cluster formation